MGRIGTGRYLCYLYYRGNLKPSAFYKENSAEYSLAKCVENVISGNGRFHDYCRRLLSGDLSRMPSVCRWRLNNKVMGGRAKEIGVQWRGVPIGQREKGVPLTLGELTHAHDECADCEVVAGEPPFEEEMRSLDGSVLTVGEIALYDMVGEQFQELVTRKA